MVSSTAYRMDMAEVSILQVNEVNHGLFQSLHLPRKDSLNGWWYAFISGLVRRASRAASWASVRMVKFTAEQKARMALAWEPKTPMRRGLASVVVRLFLFSHDVNRPLLACSALVLAHGFHLLLVQRGHFFVSPSPPPRRCERLSMLPVSRHQRHHFSATCRGAPSCVLNHQTTRTTKTTPPATHTPPNTTPTAGPLNPKGEERERMS